LERREGPGAPAIFRGCCTLATNADGVPALRLHRQLLFDANLMLPQVPKVILVQESLAESEAQVGEPDLRRVIRKPQTTGLRDAITLPPDDELMEMLAFPAHGDLEGIMQVGNGAIAADEKTPPDARTDLSQPDVELVDFGKRGRWTHAWRV
jgi:hypothetical protein